MRITAVETVPYRIPMRKPLAFASGAVDHIEHVLLRLHTDDGLTGCADIPPRPYTYGETLASVIAVIDGVFAEALLGADPLDRAGIHAHLRRTVGNQTAKGGIDVALWDLIGQAAGVSVHRLLGGYCESLAVTHMLGFAPTEAVVDEALAFIDTHGVRSFKIKVGRRPVGVDVDLVTALREAVGPDVLLYLDANRGWTATEAAQMLAATPGADLRFFEEPDDAAEVLGRRRLVATSPIPIVADESAPDLGAAAREIHTGGASALSIKTARTGFTESGKILAFAEALGLDVLMGNQIDTQLGSIATVTFGAAFEHSSRYPAELSNFLDMADDLAAEPLRIVDGRVAAPTDPGVGTVVDEDKLAHYRID
ncbi:MULTISPECIES: mandelate racemase/muconate lactonizing enzyme family protein [unclassified Brevibacterium]|uniref:mandelate racemase/muconate lactonizing enzyme family protein n=1 Tax=unclassified Brevibacterium TaxID=2614124 RepID=UPI001BA5D000|nr:enolase C-terminal domain-like protein [Brevibacterium sp. W7.2]